MYPCRRALLSGLLLAATASAGHPEFPGENLALGRQVWLDNCETCHAHGIAGAPQPDDVAQWQGRVAQGMDTLYQHALEGFFGPGGTMMPARGGNDSLTDPQVKAAVDYMVRYASQP